MNNPSQLFRRPGRSLEDCHHLDRHSRGSYRFKITLPGDRHQVGERIVVPLLTRDADEAEARAQICRDLLRRCNLIPFTEQIGAGDNGQTFAGE